MIRVRNLAKSYGNVNALSDINLEINKGEIVGVLGRNGAGKTTLMRILTTYIKPTSGTAEVAGHDILRSPVDVRRNIGYLPETPPLYPFMTIREYLKFASSLKDVPVKNCKKNIDKVLEECELTGSRDKVIGTLSKGYKQRVGIAQALLSDPPVLFLDEPTSGLDPVQIMHIRRLIRRVEREHTVIISTHILSEVSQMADRAIIIKDGKIAADEPLKDKNIEYLENTFLKVHEADMRAGA